MEVELYYFRHETIETFLRRHLDSRLAEADRRRHRRQIVGACVQRQLEKMWEQDEYFADRNDGRLRHEDFEAIGEILANL